MKILAGRSLTAILVLMLIFSATETKITATPLSANNSKTNQIKNQSLINRNLTTQLNSSDDTLVKKTALVRKSSSRSFRATAYCLKGRTATGSGVRRGIVAADRRVLPLGTKIYVESAGYSGVYTVADTGGAVKGNILDIWVPSCSEANKFGRRSINVSVVQ